MPTISLILLLCSITYLLTPTLIDTMENWTLHRIGYDEPVFALQNHVPIVRIGRANEVHKQCLGKTYISRNGSYLCTLGCVTFS